jgi:hypothetical protein
MPGKHRKHKKMAPARSRSPRHALDALEFLAAGELLAALKDVAPTANGADSATRTRTAPPSPVGEVNEVAEEEDEVEDETTQRCPHCDNTVLTSKLLSHWSSACPAVPWQCSECCAEVLKWKMRSHVCDRSTKAAGAEHAAGTEGAAGADGAAGGGVAASSSVEVIMHVV